VRPDVHLLAFLLVALERQDAGHEPLEAAALEAYTPATVNAHLDELAARGYATVERVPGRKYRAATLTADGRGWLDDHRDELKPLGTIQAPTAGAARTLAAERWPDVAPRALRVRPATRCAPGLLRDARARD